MQSEAIDLKLKGPFQGGVQRGISKSGECLLKLTQLMENPLKSARISHSLLG
jgi:hypothetical protein